MKELTNGATLAQISETTGRHRNTVRNWQRHPTMEAVRDLAHAYRGDILEGLAAAGLIDEDDVKRAHPKAALRRIESRALAIELARRLDDATAKLDGKDPLR